MRLKWLDGLVIFYGILLIAFGIQGYLKHDANSTAALITRTISGVIVIGLAAYTKTNPRVGRIGSAVIALLIMGHTFPLYFQKHGTVALILALSSLVVFCSLLGGHFAAVQKKKSGL